MIYFLVLVYTLILIYRYDIKHKKKGLKVNYYTLLIISCCIAGFSYRLGMDTVGYMIFFKSVDTDTIYVIKHIFEYRYEPLFMILLSVCKNIWDDFTLVQFVIAIFVNTTIFWFFRKNSPFFFIAILFYFVLQYWNINFEIKRESISISLFLIAIDYLLRNPLDTKNYIRYYLICIIMLFCHRFAFIALFYPICLKFKLNKITLIFISGLTLLSLLKINYLISILSHIRIFSALIEVQNAISYYTQSDKYGSGGGSIVGIFTSVILPLTIMYIVKKNVNKYIMGLAIGYIIITLFSSQIFIFYRLKNYLFFFIIIIYSFFAKFAIQRKYNKGLYISSLLGILLLSLMGKFNKDQYIRYYPYNSIFIKENNKERESEYNKLANGIDLDI